MFFGFNEEERENGSFEVSFFFFFGFEGWIVVSRLEEKEDFWIRGNSWENGIWLNLGEFGGKNGGFGNERFLKKIAFCAFFS